MRFSHTHCWTLVGERGVNSWLQIMGAKGHPDLLHTDQGLKEHVICWAHGKVALLNLQC
jgi:hypothetical protein